MFLATIVNNLDAKGRVSVPADFRAAASHDLFKGIIIWPALSGGAFFEAAGYDYVLQMQKAMQALPLYSKERDKLQNAFFGEARKLSFDSNGRVTMPKDVLEHLGVGGEIAFVGQGDSFQIWSAEARRDAAKNIQSDAMQHLHHLGANPMVEKPSGEAE